jgi:PKD repeat protein
VVWTGLALPTGDSDSVSFAVTADCVPSGTQIFNDDYVVYASEWLTLTPGLPVTVTVVQEGILADFSFPSAVAIDWPLPFANRSQNATNYDWDFGDGGKSSDVNPEHTYAGPTGDYTVTLTASNACTLSTNSQVLTVDDFDVSVEPPAQSKEAITGERISYTLSVTNDGTAEDSFQLVAWDQDWPMAVSANPVTLDSSEGTQVTVTVTVPPGANGGEQDAVELSFHSLSDPRSPAASASAALTTTASSVYSVTLEPETTWQVAVAGETVTYTLWVQNTSNRVDTIYLDRVTPGWPTVISPSSLTIARGGRRMVQVAVTMLTGLAPGAEDVAVIRATGSGSFAEATISTEVGWRIYLPLNAREAP